MSRGDISSSSDTRRITVRSLLSAVVSVAHSGLSAHAYAVDFRGGVVCADVGSVAHCSVALVYAGSEMNLCDAVSSIRATSFVLRVSV